MPEEKKAGRPEGPIYSDEQFREWLKLMEPFLENGNSLNYAIIKAGLSIYRMSIYRKYSLKDYFCERIDLLRREPGEIANEAIVTQIKNISKLIKTGVSPTADENKLLMFFAEKSRSAQPFFVNRTETANAKPIDDVLDALEPQGEEELEDDVASEIKKQMVETDTSLQDQEQAGSGSDVQAQPDATQAPA